MKEGNVEGARNKGDKGGSRARRSGGCMLEE